MTCEVVMKTRRLNHETLVKCGRPAREYVVCKRNGLGEARAKLCYTHAYRAGDDLLVFTPEYAATRKLMKTDHLEPEPLTLK